MKKVFCVKRTGFVFAVIFVFCCLLCGGIFAQENEMQAKAAESTASVKGFQTNGLTYLGDNNNEDKHIETSSYYYGSFSMWSACYKYVCTESNGSQTCYYYALIESSINSYGKYGKYRFFRNKYLDIAIDFYSKDGTILLANYTPESSDSVTDSTVNFGTNGGISVGNSGISGNAGGSVSYTETTTYDTVNLTIQKDTTSSNHKTILFHYKFMNWDNGAMEAPNIGLVRKRVVAIFAVENYNGGNNYEMSITTTATIFKDATWPRSNATLDGSVTHSY